MDPFLYGLIGLIVGAACATGLFLLMRPRELLQRFEALDRAQEREERTMREEAARSRE